MLQFALLFDDRGSAEFAASKLRDDGYRAELQRSSGWVVSATTHQAVTDIDAAREAMDALARSLGGEFLGHGGFTQIPLGQSDGSLHED